MADESIPNTGRDSVAMRWGGLAAFLAALCGFAALTPRFAVPGEWTDALLSYRGLHPFRPLSHPLWGGGMEVLSRLPLGTFAQRANLFSALCGALAVWVVFAISSSLGFRPLRIMGRYQVPGPETVRYRLIAGLVSAGFAAVSLPVLIVCTRAHPLALDGLLISLALLFAVRFRQTARMGWWYAFAFLCGVGCSEFPTFVLLSPVFALGWLWLLWRAGRLRPAPILAGAGLFLAGLSVFLVFCWMYFRSEAAAWREFAHFGDVVKYFALDQYHALRYSVPRVGWLAILLLMVAPGLVVFTSSFERESDAFSRIGSGLFRATLLGLAAVALWNLPSSPWSISEGRSVLVTPYLFAAVWFGHFTGLLLYRATSAPARSRRGRSWAGPVQRIALTGLVGVLLVGAAVRHAVFMNPAPMRELDRYVRALLDAREGRSFLLTDGAFDSLIALAADERGDPVQLLNRRLGRAAPYLRFLESRWTDPDLRSLVGAGLQPLLDNWCRDPTNATQKLAVLDHPDAWQLRGLDYVPSRGFYFGSVPSETPPPAEVYARGMAYLNEWTQAVSRAGSDFWGRERHVAWRRRLSRFANDLGVFLDARGAFGEAWNCYDQALRFNGGSMSAMANRASLAQRSNRPDRDEHLAAWKNALARQPRDFHILMAVSQDGLIHDPAVYSQEGLAWAAFGQAEYGAEKLRQAARLRGLEDMSPELRARLDVAEAGLSAEPQIFRDILAREPGNLFALSQLGRQALAQGRSAEATSLLDRMQAAGARPEDVAVQRALVHISRGEYDPARKLLLEATARSEGSPLAWVTLGAVAVQTSDAALLSNVVARLSAMPRYVPGLLFRADLEAARGHVAEARALLDQARRFEPMNKVALEKRMMLEMADRHLEEARKYAADLLHLDPEHAGAHYTIGTAFFQEGRRDLAESSFRRAIAVKPFAPAFNDLAWLLQDQGRLDEALELSRRAVDLVPTQPLFWSTQGLILSRQKKLKEAADALERALRLGARNPEALILSATVFKATGRDVECRLALDRIASVAKDLTPEQKRAYEKLMTPTAPETVAQP